MLNFYTFDTGCVMKWDMVTNSWLLLATLEINLYKLSGKLLQLSLLKWFVINIYPLYHVYYVYWSNNLSGKFLHGIWKLGPDWPDMIMRPPGLSSNHSDLLEMLNVSKILWMNDLKTHFVNIPPRYPLIRQNLYSRVFSGNAC